MRALRSALLFLLVAFSAISAAYADNQTITVATPNDLVNAFATANANPSTFYFIELTPGTYFMTSTLALTTGQAELDGAWNLLDAQSYVLDWGGTNPSANLRGMEINGGFLISGGFTLQNARVSSSGPGNLNGQGAILEVGSGYAWIDTAYIQGGRANSWGSAISVSGSSARLDLAGVVVRDNRNLQEETADPVAAYVNGCGGFNNFGGGLA